MRKNVGNIISKMKTKGSILDIMIWIAIAFVAIVFFAAWMYGHGLLVAELAAMEDIQLDNSKVSIANASADTFGTVDSALNNLHFVAFGLIFASAVSIFISNFLIKSNPVFFVIYVFFIVAVTIAAIPISNAYEALMTDAVLGAEISGFKGASFIMLHLPVWVVVIGFVGAIFLFAGIMRDAGAGGDIF